LLTVYGSIPSATINVWRRVLWRTMPMTVSSLVGNLRFLSFDLWAGEP